MVNLQQTINQGLSIAGLLYSQTADFKARQEKRELGKQSKNVSNAAGKILDQYVSTKGIKDENETFGVNWGNPSEKRQMDMFLNLVDKQAELIQKSVAAGNKDAIEFFASKEYTDAMNLRDKLKEERDTFTKDLDKLKNANEIVAQAHVNSQVSKVDEASNNAQNSMVAAQEERRNARQPGRQHINRMGRTKYIPADWRRSK